MTYFRRENNISSHSRPKYKVQDDLTPVHGPTEDVLKNSFGYMRPSAGHLGCRFLKTERL